MSAHEDLSAQLAAGGVIFDGGLGSMLIADGLEAGTAPEAWNLTHPEKVAAVHRAYLEAGADVVTSNTFGSTPYRLSRHGLSDHLAEINQAGIQLVRGEIGKHIGGALSGAGMATSHSAFVALSLGPTGLMLPPMGDAKESAIAREFETQLESVDGGFDLVLVETIFDVREGLLALAVARESTSAMVGISMTFNKTPRGFFTLMGDDVAAVIQRLEDAVPDIIGVNCSITSGDMLDLASELREATALPLLCQPNAGEPRLEGTTPVYDQTPAAFAADAARMFDLGIDAVGGCCGTTPAFIRTLSERMRTESHDA